MIASAPDSINLLGFYGLQPLGWADDSHLLIGLRGESGTEGAVLDTGSKKIRRLGEAFADEISSDGRYSVGSGGAGRARALDHAPLGRPSRLAAQERLLPGLEPLVKALLRGF